MKEKEMKMGKAETKVIQWDEQKNDVRERE
jgi:hypothetical protein